MSDIAAKVKAIIIDKLGVEEKEVTPEASFTNDLGADSLDTATASKSADGRLGDAEDGLAKSTSVLVSLGAGLAATLSFSASAELSLGSHLF